MLDPMVPESRRWGIGGGTTLASRWSHRYSTDIDIFVPVGTGLTGLHPGWGSGFFSQMKSLGSQQVQVRDRSFSFLFQDGKVDIVEASLYLADDPEIATVEDEPVGVLTSASILAGKLVGRGHRMPERDIFDLAVAFGEEPLALRAAVSCLPPDQRIERINYIGSIGDRYRQTAPQSILNPSEKWEYLLEEAPEQALHAIDSSVYGRPDIEYGPDGADVVLPVSDGSVENLNFPNGTDLLRGLRERGVDRFVVLPGPKPAEEFVQQADDRIGLHTAGNRPEYPYP